MPQESVLGVTLSNVLELALEWRAKSMAFVDQALIVIVDSKAGLVRITNKNLKRVNMWM